MPTSSAHSDSNYRAVNHYISAEIIDKGIGINRLDSVTSTVGALHRGFREYGWTIENRKESPEGPSLKYLVSPDGDQELRMVDGKIWRHPQLTDLVCKSKTMTKKFLGLNSVPFPSGAEFGLDQKQFAEAYLEKMGGLSVIKPAGAGGSKGVTIGVTPGGFEAAWNHAVRYKGTGDQVIVEEFVRGIELRLLVVGGKLAGAVIRNQPFVVGDGASTIDELVVQLTQERSTNLRASKGTVNVMEDFLRTQGYERTSIPAVDEVILLAPFTILRHGGGTIDVTDAISDDLIALAIKAVQSIPNLEVAGVDILTESLQDADSARVVEVNTAAALDLHRYPTYGKEQNVIQKIVDYFCK